MKTLPKKTKKQGGSTLIEYALLVAFIAVNVVAAVRYLGQSAQKSYDTLKTEMSGSGGVDDYVDE